MIVGNERLALQKRFSDEGLEVNLPDDRKLPHVWRWLQDAESNCLSLRKQIEKLHKQHEKDIQEVEHYVEHVWHSTSEKMKYLESENARLSKDLDLHMRKVEPTRIENICDTVKARSAFGNFLQIKRRDKSVGGSHFDAAAIASSHYEALDMCHKCNTSLKKKDETIRALLIVKKKLESDKETLALKLSELRTSLERMARQQRQQKRNSNCKGDDEPAVKSSALDVGPDRSLQSISGPGREDVEGNGSNSLIEKLEAEVEQLRKVLKNKEVFCANLISQYERRKTRHKQKIAFLRDHVEREKSRWQQLFQAANLRRRVVAQELEMHKQNFSALEQIAK